MTDLVLAISVIGLVYWYLRRAARSSTREAASGTANAGATRKASLSLSDLLVLVGLIALPMGYWKHEQHMHRVEQQIEKQISSKAAVKFGMIAPRIFIRRAPRALLDNWMRITRVDLHQPEQEDVEAVCRLPHLRSLRWRAKRLGDQDGFRRHKASREIRSEPWRETLRHQISESLIPNSRREIRWTT